MATLILLHSIFRWLVVIALCTSIIVAWRGFKFNLVFNKTANLLRHWTATIAHIQLLIGMLLIFQSAYFKYFWKHTAESWGNSELVFYGLIHPLLMIIAITILTVGSAKAKRKETDRQKFQTMLIWFGITAVILFVAIPWPFSPLANRPLLPNF